MHLQAGQCGNQIGSKVRAPREEMGPRFVTCANDLLSKSDIAWPSRDRRRFESSVGSGRRRVKGEGRREGSMSHSKRLSKKWEGNLYVANRLFDFGFWLLGKGHKRTCHDLPPCILRLVGRRPGGAVG